MPDEVISTRLEAVKAASVTCVSNLAENVLADNGCDSEPNLQLRAGCAPGHTSGFQGKKFEFPLPPLNWSADVSITDLGSDATQRAAVQRDNWIPGIVVSGGGMGSGTT